MNLHARTHLAVTDLADGGGPNYNQYHPDQNAVPHNQIFGTLMDGLMWVGFMVAGIAVLAGIAMWSMSHATGHHGWNTQGKGAIGKGLAGGILLGSFGTIMNFFVSH